MTIDYLVGIDVGDKSVGMSAIKFDDKTPIQILNSHVVRHDGGDDPSTGKSPRSRKATAGEARRTRKMLKRRKKRLKALDQYLASNGYPLEYKQKTPYDAWRARHLLVTKEITDEDTRKEYLSLALRHMARHRGWRNPYASLARTRNLPVPSETMVRNIERAREILDTDIPDDVTLGTIGYRASHHTYLLRPRAITVTKTATTQQEKALKEFDTTTHPTEPILGWKVLQEDQLHELKLICETQKITELYPIFEELVFTQEKPVVPTERVGRDVLQPHLLRAPMASIEFQMFRLYATLMNLRIRGNEDRALTPEEIDLLAEYIISADGDDITWADCADQIGIDHHTLKAPTYDDLVVTRPPMVDSYHKVRKAIAATKDKVALTWWDEAGVEEKKLLVRFIADSTEETYALVQSSGLSDTLSLFADDTVEAIMGTSLASGRAAYSIDTLHHLTVSMRTHHLDLHHAIKAVFGLDAETIPQATLDDPTGQPTVDRVITIVRDYLKECEKAYGGPPRKIIVEHVRSSMLGAEARSSYIREMNMNRAQNLKVTKELKDLGLESPRRSDIRRYHQVKRQKEVCLYCGTAITPLTAELDHIIARRGGGSSQGVNLVAVCRECNRQKNNQLYSTWEEVSSRTDMKETIARLKKWKGLKPNERREITRRLKQDRSDPPLDERDLASTSYAATALTSRIRNTLNVPVEVYSGAATRESRRAGGVDQTLRLHGFTDKVRLDARHHAIDSAVITLLRPGVFQTLITRSNMKRENDVNCQYPDWREFTGIDYAHRTLFTEWKKNIAALTNLLVEYQDQITIAKPVRRTLSRGSVHKDTVKETIFRPYNRVWTKDEIYRVCDHRIYRDLLGLIGTAKTLDLTDSTITTQVPMYPQTNAMVRTPRGCVEISPSLHHVRLMSLSKTDKKGNVSHSWGITRMYSAELPTLMRLTDVKDVYRVPVMQTSAAYRTAHPKVKAGLEDGTARYVAWITQGSELRINPEAFADDTSIFGQFLKEYPETQWFVAGAGKPSQITIRPLRLAFDKDVKLSPVAEKVLFEGMGISVNTLFETNVSVIIRNAIGEITKEIAIQH